MRRVKAFLRGSASTALFCVFGAGAILASPLIALLARPERAQPVVRALWRPMVALFVLLRLIRIDRGNLERVQGHVIAADHPSLIDVMILSVIFPRTLYVAKHALRFNPVMSAIVKATSLPDDANLPEAAAPYLARGWNVLVFPEGTRSPAEGGLHPFRRGAAHLALRAAAPVLCVGTAVSRRILAKRQRPWDLGPDRVTYAYRCSKIDFDQSGWGVSRHKAALALTAEMRRRIEALRNGREISDNI